MPFPDLAIAGLIDLISRCFTQLVGDPEIGLQLKANPVVQRTPDEAGYSMSKGAEFFLCRRFTCDQTFFNPSEPHGTPLVVIMLQPQVADIGKLFVFQDFSGRQVAVVIKYRCMFCVTMVQTAS